MSRLFKRFLVCAAALLALGLAADAAPYRHFEQFQNPDSKYRPFVRWWWNGDRVEADELVRELHLLKEAGIGGVEINPVGFPGGDEAGTKELIWLSDEWIDMLKVVFDEAEKIGMTCDLIIGSGWPFGSETLPWEERASVMLTYAQPLPENIKTFQVSKFHIFRAIDPGVTKVTPSRIPTLIACYLVPDPIEDLSQAIDITDKFDGDMLTIEVPEGKHQLYALVKYESFASVICGAPGAAGPILNHMDEQAVKNYLNHMTDAIEGRIGPLNKHLRAFFVDSMELEGCNWTGDFAEEFKARRGYDLMPWLPFTMFKTGRLGNVDSYDYGSKKGEDFEAKVNRVRFDFELTKAELLQERYVKTYTSWCREKGVKSRAQAYGRGFFQLEPSLEHDIPEGESWTTNYLRHRIGEEMGDEDYRRGRGYTMIDKYVSSAAHLTGKRLVSCEEMTNTYKVFSTPLEFIKVGSDMAAEAGITHSVWHGFNYNPPKAGFPGWIRYGSYYNEKNTWWPYFKLLNDYRARMSSLLQNSDMYTDIALLPANYDMWSEIGVTTEPFPEKLNVPYTSLIWEAIHKNGGGADYVTENILNDAVVKNGKICYGPKQYGTIFLIEVSSTTPHTLALLLDFVQQGGRVFCINKFPCKSLGLNNYEERDAQITAAVEELKKYPDNFILLENPSDGKYLEWYTEVMNKYNIPHAITVTNPDRFLLQNHYVMDDKSEFFFFANTHMSEARSTDIIFPASVTRGRHAWIYDASTGKRYAMPIGKDGKLSFEFGPSESYVFMFNKETKGEKWAPLPITGTDTLAVRNWDLTLVNPQIDTVITDHFDELTDLQKTEKYSTFMGTVTYKTTVNLGKELPRYINLGRVCDICELSVNGKNLGVDWFGRRVYDLTGALVEGDNTIEVKVTTVMANYTGSFPDGSIAKKWTKGATPSMGLIGPVKLYR